jgi:RNA polymerase sigma-70 factor (ECF subfamily)
LIVSCVLRTLRRYGAYYSQEDLQDLVSEVWLALLRDDCKKLQLFNPDRGYRLSSWLGLIATNSTIDCLRSRSAPTTYLEDMVDAERFLADDSRPDAELELQESMNIARTALHQLNKHELAFIVDCFGEERAPTALADELGVTVNTIYSRKFKLRAKLARIVAEINVDPVYA